MTTTQGEHAQTEALRLADAIDPFTRKSAHDHLTSKVAADELRRLHAQVAALTAAPVAQPELNARVHALNQINVEQRKLLDAMGAHTAQPAAAPQGAAYAELPEGWPARFRCDSCDGNGEVGEPMYMGHFQPPERARCPDCDGRGWCSEEPAFSADHMRDFADRTHALRASHRQAPAGAALPEGWVPLVITHDGQYPEEVAYGPQRMMDRLGKWLRKYFDSVAAPTAQPAPAAFQRALDIRVAQGWQLGGNKVPVLYTDSINGEQVSRDDLWLCTTAALATQAAAGTIPHEALADLHEQLAAKLHDGPARNLHLETAAALRAPAAGAVAGPDGMQDLHDLLYKAQRTTGDVQSAAITQARVLLSKLMAPRQNQRVYGPYDCAFMGAGVWAGIVDELPPELVGQKVYVTAAAPTPAAQADSVLAECGNCFEGKSDFDHVCKHCGGSGKVADSVLEDAARPKFWKGERVNYTNEHHVSFKAKVKKVETRWSADRKPYHYAHILIDGAKTSTIVPQSYLSVIDTARKQGAKHD